MSFIELLADFHFLRPEWLSAFLLLPLLWLLIKQLKSGANDWETSIDPRLLAHLIPSKHAPNSTKSNALIYLIIATAILSLAGPTWKRINQPITTVSDDMIIILDLSISMLATDQKPNRLTRAKQKLSDLLEKRDEGNTALIVYSGDSHVVTPLTDDTNTIHANLSALDPFIMPVIGSRPDLAIIQAKKLFEDAGSRKKRITLFTDDVTTEQIETINDVLSDEKIQLNVIGVGTPEGGPIDIPGRGYFKTDDVTIIPKTNFRLLDELTQGSGGRMFPLSLDDSDINKLDSQMIPKNASNPPNGEHNDSNTYDTWEDKGYLFILIILPLSLLVYKKNLLLSLALIFVLQTYNEPVYAFGWQDLWLTKDQQAQRLSDQGRHEEAKNLFQSTDHKAYAEYQTGDFEGATKSYKQVLDNMGDNAFDTQTSTDALFNLGTSLAKQMKLEESLEMFNKLLERAPDHKDALHNKSIVEELLKNSEQQSDDNDQNSDSQNTDKQELDSSEENIDKNQESKNSEDSTRDSNSSDQQDSKDQNQQNDQENGNPSDQTSRDQDNKREGSQSPQSEQANTEKSEQELIHEDFRESPENSESAKDHESQSLKQLESQLSDEEKQSYEQWMRRVPDDPSGLLRRKFEQQALERQRRGQSSIDDSDGPVW